MLTFLTKTSLKFLLFVLVFLGTTAQANGNEYLFPDTLGIPLIGPSQIAETCYSQAYKDEIEKDNGISLDEVSVACTRLKISEVDTYDEENDIFLFLAYANILHDRGWRTIDSVDGRPLLESPIMVNNCKQYVMIGQFW